MHATGISILTEGGLKHRTDRLTKGLCNQINGFCGSIGYTHLVGQEAIPISQLLLQAKRLGLGIAANKVKMMGQVVLQTTQVHVVIDV